MPQIWTVTIEELGRGGTVRYREAEGVIACDWEFSGGDTIASIRVGTEAEWRASHPWAVARRAEIVDRIGADVIRQRAPSCRFELDEANGWMHLLTGTGSTPPSIGAATPSEVPPAGPVLTTPADAAAAFYRRYSRLRGKFAIGAGIVAIAVAALLWVGRAVFMVETTGRRTGDSVRAGDTIATLVQRLEPYIPSLHRDPSKDRYSIGILLHSTDGSAEPKFVPLGGGHRALALQNARFLGVDAERIWFLAPEPGALDRRTGRVLDEDDLASVRSRAPTPSGKLSDLATGDRAVLLHLAAGGLVSPTRFIALLSESEATRDFKRGSTAKAIVAAERSSEPKRLWFGDVELDNGRQRLKELVDPAGSPPSNSPQSSSSQSSSSQPSSPQPTSPPSAPSSGAPQPGSALYHAAFLRASRDGPLLQLSAPDSVLRIHHPDRFRTGTAVLARLDLHGTVLWERDLGIAEVEQVLPDPERPAFIGTKPATPGKVPDAILVIVDTATGAATTHSLP